LARQVDMQFNIFKTIGKNFIHSIIISSLKKNTTINSNININIVHASGAKENWVNALSTI
jgi:hypothetical protein